MKRFIAITLCFVILILSCVAVVLTDKKSSGDNTELFYLHDGYIIKTESEYNKVMADYAVRLFTRIYDEQLGNCENVYFALIPDKHRIVSGKDDYNNFIAYMKESLPFAETVEIADLLTLSDYYRTDPHWKQECIVDVASRLCESMGTVAETDFEKKSVQEPYYGVYSAQSGFDTESDTLTYLVSDSIDNAQIIGANAIYDLKKFYGDDPYYVFLSGNQPVVTISNDEVTNGKRLVIFRDSFSSSIAPIIMTAYSEVVLIDLRYIMSESLSEYIDFDDADVLFLYSTLLLNNSMSMK